MSIKGWRPQHRGKVAQELLKLDHITCDHILEAVLKGGLRPQRRAKTCAEGDEDPERIRTLVFGAHGHGPHCGIRSRIDRFPNLVALIDCFMKQEMQRCHTDIFRVAPGSELYTP